MNYSLIEYIATIPFVLGIIISVIKKRWIYLGIGLAISMFIMSFGPQIQTRDGIISSLVVLAIILFVYKKQQDRIKRYQESTYYKQTQSDYQDVMKRDKGKYGEFLVFDELRPLEADGARFLFNAYIPKEDGTTSEIDVIILTKAGIFVVESKNYSGWIFGDKDSKKWMATLQSGEKINSIILYGKTILIANT